MQYIVGLGSNTNIKAFTLNWIWISDDVVPNWNIEEGNCFMEDVAKRFTVTNTDG